MRKNSPAVPAPLGHKHFYESGTFEIFNSTLKKMTIAFFLAFYYITYAKREIKKQ